ncbi:hypothetical protein V1274_001416 [Bradyrhizobium sp. AZCC 1614]|uniref:hypothetical protein n=1 Tax=unclassified Bradyrhizobium TaxID=2631580 RepID=UPI002FEE6CCE
MDECSPACARHACGNALEECWREMKRETPVALRMLMPALEAAAGIAEQKRSRHERRGSNLRPVLKASLRHWRDCRFGMLLDESVIVRPVVADHVTHAPTGTRRQYLNLECHNARTHNLVSGSPAERATGCSGQPDQI